MNNIAITDLPKEIVTNLSGNCQYLLLILNQLCKCTSKRSPSKAWYCFPSEEYLAKRTGRSRVQVSRSIQVLKHFGLIHVTYRRQDRDGRWRTNLYRLGETLKHWLNIAKSLRNGLSYRVTSMLHIVSKTLLSEEPQSLKGLKQHLKSRGSPDLEVIISRMTPKVLSQES